MSTLLSYARMNEIGWSEREAFTWYLYNFAMAMIIAVPERMADGSKRACYGNALFGAMHPKAVSWMSQSPARVV